MKKRKKIKRTLMNKAIIKRENSVGYFSAYYRGLECLLDMWPTIRASVPDATLDVYYGWESWVGLEGEDDFYVRMCKKFVELEGQGVTVHGRVSHETLAKAMKEIQVWAYPTQFTEIHCITALKAQEAGCYPVVTNVAALAETVQSGDKLNTRRIYNDEYQQEKFAKKVIEALKEGKTGTPVPNVDWQDVATQWINVIKEKLNEREKSQATA
jgi:glycosyltransferase involved in cell wall biosynthesis